MAKSRFCAIPFSSLAEADFATNGDSGLHEKTIKVKLGGCDAFFSHSWHDAAAPKWRALHLWADTFSTAHGRAPLIWLDKVCAPCGVGTHAHAVPRCRSPRELVRLTPALAVARLVRDLPARPRRNHSY